MSGYRVCPHCNDSVSTKVYKEHERLYYDKEDGTWITLRQLNDAVDSEEENDFPSPPSTVSVFTGTLDQAKSCISCYNYVSQQSQRVNNRGIVNHTSSLITISSVMMMMRMQWK